MTITLPEPTEPKRDRYGRYVLVNPETGKEASFTRATTIAKAAEDQGGLIKWGQRMVTLGMGRRPDLVELAATTNPDDKSTLSRIAADAEEAGGAASGRNRGTAIHSAVEARHRGLEVPEAFTERVEAYVAELARCGLAPVPDYAERICVRWAERIAGMFDIILTDGKTLFMSDIKSGSVAYPASFAIQLAIYAGADDLVVSGNDTFEPMPAVDADRGYIIHLPADGGCTISAIDLQAGRRGLAVALDVRRWRSEATAKNLLETAGTDVLGAGGAPEGFTASTPGSARLTWFRDRYATICEAGHQDTVKELWPSGVPGPKRSDEWSADQIAAAVKALDAAEARHEMPFGKPDPAKTHVPREKPAPVEVTVFRDPDDGAEAPAEAVKALKAQHSALSEPLKGTIKRWRLQGTRASRSWGNKPATERSVKASEAALLLCRHSIDDDTARAWIAKVIGDDDTQRHPVGALIGSLSIAEAQELTEQLECFAARTPDDPFEGLG